MTSVYLAKQYQRLNLKEWNKAYPVLDDPVTCCINHQISTELWTSCFNCSSALCSEYFIPPNDSATYALHYTRLWRPQYTRVKTYEPEYQSLCSIKSRFLIPNVDHPYIYQMPKVDHLAENDPYLPHGRPYNIANTITSDVNPNTTSLVTFMFIQLV